MNLPDEIRLGPVDEARGDHVGALQRFVSAHRSLFVLTGAGISTGSGIPDYRDRDGGWKGATPIQHQAFVSQLSRRRRYWARSMAGWPAVARARPNAGHAALARLGAAGRIGLLVTQNVDGLHQAAGNRSAVDLHGRLDRVICLDCDTRLSRHRVQEMLVDANRGWLHDSDAIRPDGDIELGDVDYDSFVVPDCPVCRGILKPDVVFFGGAVPKRTVARAWAGLGRADAVLVVGSSLMVWSGFRFVREAARQGLPIMAINHGRTRADDLITHKLDDDCAALLDTAIA
jgi:NAD-dependent SIR2 family protein deacetylase